MKLPNLVGRKSSWHAPSDRRHFRHQSVQRKWILRTADSCSTVFPIILLRISVLHWSIAADNGTVVLAPTIASSAGSRIISTAIAYIFQSIDLVWLHLFFVAQEQPDKKAGRLLYMGHSSNFHWTPRKRILPPKYNVGRKQPSRRRKRWRWRRLQTECWHWSQSHHSTTRQQQQQRCSISRESWSSLAFKQIVVRLTIAVTCFRYLHGIGCCWSDEDVSEQHGGQKSQQSCEW